MSQWLCQQAESEKWSRGKSMINVVVFLLVVNLNRGRNFSIMFAVGFFVFICVVFKDFLKGLIFFFLSFTDKTNCQSKCAKTIIIVKENKLMPSQKRLAENSTCIYLFIFIHSMLKWINHICTWEGVGLIFCFLTKYPLFAVSYCALQRNYRIM